MTSNEIVAKTDKSFGIFPTLGMTGIVAFFYYQEGKNLFNWKKFNPNGINTIFFLLVLSFCILTWIFFFDTDPQIKLDNNGIWKRKNLFSHLLVNKASWDDIAYFFVQQETKKGFTTQTAIFRIKDSEREISIGMTGLDKTSQAILDVVKTYSTHYNFQDLGLDIK